MGFVPGHIVFTTTYKKTSPNVKNKQTENNSEQCGEFGSAIFHWECEINSCCSNGKQWRLVTNLSGGATFAVKTKMSRSMSWKLDFVTLHLTITFIF